MPSRWTALQPLRSTGFRYLFVAGSLWYFGRWMETVVLGWLVLQITNSPFHVAMVAFFRTAPAFFLSLLSGPIADRVSRRRLIMGTQILNFCVTVALLLIVAAGIVEFWHIAVATTVMGVSWALDWPNRRAYLMDVVGPDQIHGSVVLDTVAGNLSRIIGPLSGGSVIALIGVTGSYWILAGGYLISVVCLWLVPRVKEARAAREPIGRSLATGMAYARRNEAILGVLAVTVVMNVGIFQHNQLFSVFARDVLYVNAFLLGLLASADGIGSTVGALVLGFWLRDRRRGQVFLICSLGKAIFVGLFALSPWFPTSFGLLILAGFAHTGFTAYQTLIPLVIAPPEMRGRMMALIALAIGTTPIGAFALGALANATTAPIAVFSMAAASVLCLAIVWFRLPELRRV